MLFGRANLLLAEQCLHGCLKMFNPSLYMEECNMEDKDYYVVFNGNITVETNACSSILALEGALSFIKRNYPGIVIRSVSIF